MGSSEDMAGRDEGTSTPADSLCLNLLLYCSVSEMQLPGFESSSGHKPHVPRVNIHLSFCTSNNLMFTVAAARPELMDLLILRNSIDTQISPCLDFTFATLAMPQMQVQLETSCREHFFSDLLSSFNE